MATRLTHGSDHVGGCARCGNPDHRIFRRDVVRLQFFPSACRIVFGILHRIAECRLSAGNQSDHQRIGHPERRRYLRGVEYSQPAACAGAHVKDASALLHAGYDLRDEFLYLRNGFLYGQCHFPVFPIDIVQNLPDGFLL